MYIYVSETGCVTFRLSPDSGERAVAAAVIKLKGVVDPVGKLRPCVLKGDEVQSLRNLEEDDMQAEMRAATVDPDDDGRPEGRMREYNGIRVGERVRIKKGVHGWQFGVGILKAIERNSEASDEIDFGIDFGKGHKGLSWRAPDEVERVDRRKDPMDDLPMCDLTFKDEPDLRITTCRVTPRTPDFDPTQGFAFEMNIETAHAWYRVSTLESRLAGLEATRSDDSGAFAEKLVAHDNRLTTQTSLIEWQNNRIAAMGKVLDHLAQKVEDIAMGWSTLSKDQEDRIKLLEGKDHIRSEGAMAQAEYNEAQDKPLPTIEDIGIAWRGKPINVEVLPAGFEARIAEDTRRVASEANTKQLDERAGQALALFVGFMDNTYPINKLNDWWRDHGRKLKADLQKAADDAKEE